MNHNLLGNTLLKTVVCLELWILDIETASSFTGLADIKCGFQSFSLALVLDCFNCTDHLIFLGLDFIKLVISKYFSPNKIRKINCLTIYQCNNTAAKSSSRHSTTINPWSLTCDSNNSVQLGTRNIIQCTGNGLKFNYYLLYSN